MWIALAVSLPAAEPPLKFGRLTTEHGLSSNWVMAVLRDSRGFLWIGTEDGLNRYDGRAFRIYRPVAGDVRSLPSRAAATLLEDSRHRLWIGTGWGNQGLALYEPERDAFKRFPHGPGSGGLSGHQVRALAEADDGRLWVATERGVELFDPERGLVKTYAPASTSSGRDGAPLVLGLVRDHLGQLWIGTTAGLMRLDRQLDRCVPWSGFDGRGPEGLDRAIVTDVAEDRDGRLWVADFVGGLYCLDPGQGRVTHYLPRPGDPTSLSHVRTRRLAFDGSGRLWIGTENGGLNILDPRTGRFSRYMPEQGNRTSLASASLYALHVDRQGIVWIGTYNGGLSYVSPYEQWFDLVPAGCGGLSDPHVSAIMEDRAGNLWLGTDGGGLNRVDARSGRYSFYRSSKSDPATIGSDSVFTLAEDENGTIWLGGWDGGLAGLDPRSGRVKRFRHDERDPTSIVGNDVWRIRLLRSGELLVATQQGIDLFDRRRGKFRRLAARYPGVPAQGAFSILEDRRDGLWIGGNGSVVRIDTASGAITRYVHDPNDARSLADAIVVALYEDSAGTIWLGTGGGLYRVPAAAVGQPLARVEGLPHESATNIQEDGSGNLWVSSNHGISRLVGAVRQPAAPSLVVHYDTGDGLQAAEFTRGASFRGREGRLYFGGTEGFNIFYPDRIRLNREPPPVVLTDLKIFNRSVAPGDPGSPLERSIGEARALTLSQDQIAVTFEFAALNLAMPRKNRYAYRLDGLEHDWNDAAAQATATYTRLPHGRYVLRVRASNNDGVWNESGLALPIEVLPRWHQRRALQIPLALAAVLGLVAGYRYRVRHLEVQRRDLAARVDERTRDLHRLNEELEERVSARTRELEEEKERLAVTLRSIGDAVIATDVESRVVLLNRMAEQLTGWSVQEAVGRPLGEVLPLRDTVTRAPRPDPVAAVLKGESVWALPVESLLVRRDGSEALVADSVARICDRESRTLGVVLVFRDVSERRKVEEQLQSAQKLEALGVLAGGIAHDFNNLLTGVFGYVDLAKRRCQDRPQAVATLGKALAVIEKARGLTGQLLTFSRGGEPVRAPLALGELLRKCIDFALSGSSVVCEAKIAEDLWPCQGDRRQIDQVVDNLLLNARQAMPEGGKIELSAENVEIGEDLHLPLAPGRYARVTVRDHGVGIAPDVRARIFEPFFTTKPEGTGLGLATTYSIVRKHGGHIEVESEPGKGTSFAVYLPASRAAAVEEDDAAVVMAAGQGRILVMDDEDYVRDVAREMLEGLGYDVTVVVDGSEALRAYERARAGAHPFDLVLLDLTIPGGLGGLATLMRLRAIEPGILAIASSGYSGDPIMANPYAHGFAAHLTKPYATNELADVVARVLARKQK